MNLETFKPQLHYNYTMYIQALQTILPSHLTVAERKGGKKLEC